MKRTACSCVLLAAAAIAACGCSSAPSPPGTPGASIPPAPGKARVIMGEHSCVLLEKRVVIDFETFNGNLPKEVTWERDRGDRNAKFTAYVDPNDPSKSEKYPDLFPGVPGQFSGNDKEKKSGKPTREPDWTADPDGNPNSYTFRYTVKRTGWGGRDCDPEICIRKSGNGCSG